MPTDEMTPGEVARCLERIDQTLEKMNNKMDNHPTWDELKRIELQLSKDIARLQDVNKWAGRVIVGAVLLGVLDMLFGSQSPATVEAVAALSQSVRL